MTETVIKKRRVLTLKIKPETKVLIEEKTSALEEKMLLEEKISTAEEKISTKDTTDEAKTVAELKKLPKKKKKKAMNLFILAPLIGKYYKNRKMNY